MRLHLQISDSMTQYIARITDILRKWYYAKQHSVSSIHSKILQDERPQAVRLCGRTVTVLAWTAKGPGFESWFSHLSWTNFLISWADMPRYKLFMLKVPLNTNRTTVHSLLRPGINDFSKTSIYREIQETDFFVTTYVMAISQVAFNS